jgi:hypothetical protein
MDGQNQSYYINIQSNEIFRRPDEGEWNFKIEATESQVYVLERLLNTMMKQIGKAIFDHTSHILSIIISLKIGNMTSEYD